MKIKNLIIVSLILAILTIGAVSAAENITSDDQLAVGEDVDVQESPQDDVLSDSPKKSDFYVDFSEIIAVNSKDYVIDIYEQTADGVNGNLTVSVGDNEPIYNKKFDYSATLKISDLGITSPGIYKIHANFIPVKGNSIVLLDDTLNVTEKEGYGDMTVNIYNTDYNPGGWDDDDDYNLLVNIWDMPSNGTVLVYIDGDLCYNGTGHNIYLDYLNKKPSIGRHYVKVSFWNGKNETVVNSRMVKIGYHLYVDEHDDAFYLGENVELYLYFPKDAKGDLYVIVDGKSQKIARENGKPWVKYTMKTNSLKLKDYIFRLELRNDPFYPFKTYEFEFTMIPHIYYFDMAVGEKGYVTLELPKGYKGTLKLYKTKDGKYKKVKSGKAIKTVKVKNGKAYIPISYSKKGEKNFIIEYVDGKYVYTRLCYFFVYKNDKKISSSISSNKIKFNKKVVVKLKGPKNFKRFYIYVDGKYLKSVKLNKKGIKKVSIRFNISGKHSIKVITDGYSSKFYSNTFTIKVKQPDVKLTLKKITLKKPMKKVTLKSTLKIKGKAKKGLKVKFKFNKKSYKAKTNKKGIAKVTIKKSVLKKLKVGQTVKYQVKYGKTVTTKSTKVKN